MNDMLETAARALAQEIGEPIVSHATIRKDWSSMTDTEIRALRFGARAALLAALDPEDEALVEALSVALYKAAGNPDEGPVSYQPTAALTALDYRDEARAAIETLRRITQGET